MSIQTSPRVGDVFCTISPETSTTSPKPQTRLGRAQAVIYQSFSGLPKYFKNFYFNGVVQILKQIPTHFQPHSNTISPKITPFLTYIHLIFTAKKRNPKYIKFKPKSPNVKVPNPNIFI